MRMVARRKRALTHPTKLSHGAMMPRYSRPVTANGQRLIIVRVGRVERANRRPAGEHISVGMIERVGAGLLDRGLREHRRGDDGGEKRGRNNWDEFCHGEHLFRKWDLSHVGAVALCCADITAI